MFSDEEITATRDWHIGFRDNLMAAGDRWTEVVIESNTIAMLAEYLDLRGEG